jgi:NAD(P)-dependent dehydrogenase (short-subunit alcohol dehydrogenase family)
VIFDFLNKTNIMNNFLKTALITGANRGLGIETAKQLSKNNIRVIVTARKEHLLQKVKDQFEMEGIAADFLKLDVTNYSEIKDVVNYISRAYRNLDILINNAGISLEKSASYQVNNSADVDIDMIKNIYETNVFGLISVTQAMLPLLTAGSRARIVNVSSELGSITLHADCHSSVYKLKKFAYNSSKTIVNQFTVHLAEKLKELNIKINSVSPGWVKTEMGTQYAPLEISEGADIIVKAAMLPDDGPSGCFFTHEMKRILW